MNRVLALGLTLVVPGLAFAADPPQWPPRAATPNPILKAAHQAPDVPAVPAPGTPPAAPVALPPVSSGTGSAALMPLPGLLTSGMLPTTPTVPAAGCDVPGGCATDADRGRPPFGAGLGPCVDRFKRWLAFQPGPPVVPTCVPEPYHPPVRTFFPCKPNAGCGAGGLSYGNGANGCGAGGLGCGNGANGGVNGGAAGGPIPTLADRFGLGTGSGCGPDGCPAPKHKGLGACARPSQVGATTGEIACEVGPVSVPLPAGCVGSGTSGYHGGCDTLAAACGTGCGHGSAVHRLLHGLGSCRHQGGCSAGGVVAGGVTGSVVPVVMGYTRPAVGGYRYADPLGVPGVGNTSGGPSGGQPGGAMVPQQTVAPVQHTVPATPAANRPFTNP